MRSLTAPARLGVGVQRRGHHHLARGRFTPVRTTGPRPQAQAGHGLAALGDGRLELVGVDGRAFALRP